MILDIGYLRACEEVGLLGDGSLPRSAIHRICVNSEQWRCAPTLSVTISRFLPADWDIQSFDDAYGNLLDAVVPRNKGEWAADAGPCLCYLMARRGLLSAADLAPRLKAWAAAEACPGVLLMAMAGAINWDDDLDTFLKEQADDMAQTFLALFPHGPFASEREALPDKLREIWAAYCIPGTVLDLIDEGVLAPSDIPEGRAKEWAQELLPPMLAEFIVMGLLSSSDVSPTTDSSELARCIDWQRRRRGMSGNGSGLVDLSSGEQAARFRADLQSLFGVASVEFHDILAGGLSGSEVRLCTFALEDRCLRLGVLKRTTKRGDFDREVAGNELAAQSWLAHSGLVQPEVPMARSHPSGKEDIILCELALPPPLGATAPRVNTLHDYVQHRDAETAGKAVASVGRAYAGCLGVAGGEPCSGPAWEELLGIREHWAKPVRDGVWESSRFWRELGLPGLEQPGYREGDRLRPNPLYAFTHEEWWRGQTLHIFKGLQHGDLNTNNVLVYPSEDGIRCCFIDFEKVTQRASLALDPCWLAIWLVAAAAGGADLTPDELRHFPEAFTECAATGKMQGAEIMAVSSLPLS
jgi:hypothetical protein